MRESIVRAPEVTSRWDQTKWESFMARANRKQSSRSSTSGYAARGRAGSRRKPDAIALLKADHRQVEEWFGEFDKARASQRKTSLAASICKALRVHTLIEHEIFYPAFLEATGDKEAHHEAEIEHASATRLIKEIEASGPDDEYFDSRVTVLSEMIRHHVREEEKPDGMFAEAGKSDMDLELLGEALRERKQQLMSSDGAPLRRRGEHRSGASA